MCVYMYDIMIFQSNISIYLHYIQWLNVWINQFESVFLIFSDPMLFVGSSVDSLDAECNVTLFCFLVKHFKIVLCGSCLYAFCSIPFYYIRMIFVLVMVGCSNDGDKCDNGTRFMCKQEDAPDPVVSYFFLLFSNIW